MKFKSLYWIVSFVFILQIIGVENSFSQSPVQIQVRVIPPYQSRITEYASRPELLMINLINPNRSPVQLQLTGSLTGDNGIMVQVKPGFKSSKPINLLGGQSLTLNGNDLQFLFDANQIVYQGISKTDFIRGGLKEGVYELCVKALDYTTQEPLSLEGAGCTQIVLRSLEPPTILNPIDEQSVLHQGVQSFPITWSTPSGAPPSTQYIVKIVEITVPRNPNDAMQSATTPAFFEEKVQANAILYGPQYPQLTPGRKYAIRVQAIDPFGQSSFRNQGLSEVVSFSYEDLMANTQTGSQVVEEKDALVVKHNTKIKGKLSFRFAESNEAEVFPVANQRVYLEKVQVPYTVDAAGLEQDLPNRIVSGEIMESTEVMTDENGNFEIQAVLTDRDSSGRSFSIAGRGMFRQKYRVSVDNAFFKKSTHLMTIQPGGVFGEIDQDDPSKVQEIILDANSFTLGVNVLEVFKGEKGNYAEGEEIRIYRSLSPAQYRDYGVPRFEGDQVGSLLSTNAVSSEGAQVLIATRKTPQGVSPKHAVENYVYFPRLFKSPGGDHLTYQIVLMKGGEAIRKLDFYATQQLSFSGTKTNSTYINKQVNYSYSGQADTALLTIEKTLTVAPRSQVKGQLQYAVKGKPGIPSRPYANMPVKLMVFYYSLQNASNSAGLNSGTSITSNTALKNSSVMKMNDLSANVLRNSVMVNTYANQDRGSNSGAAVLSNTIQLQVYKRESREIIANGVSLSDNGKVLKTVMTDADGNFVFDFDNADSTNIVYKNVNMVSGHGDLMSTQIGTVKRVYRIVPDVPYFTAPDDDVSVQPWEDLDIGTLTAYVNTYTLEVKVEQFTNSASGVKAVSDVKIQLLSPPIVQKNRPSILGVDIGTKVDLRSSKASGSSNTGWLMYNPPYTLKQEQLSTLDAQGNSVVRFKDVVVSQRGNMDNLYIYADTSNRLSNRSFEAVGMLFPSQDKNAYTQAERNAPPAFYVHSSEMAYVPIGGILFNSELDPNRVANATLRIRPKGTLISGRVLDSYTQLGISGIKVYVTEVLNGPSGRKDSQFFDESTDGNGYFRFDQYSEYLESYEREMQLTGGINTQYAYGKYENTVIRIEAPGYEPFEKKLGLLDGDNRQGLNLYQTIALKPLASQAFGYVVDADNPKQAVAARVKLKVNGRWVDTHTYTGDPYAVPNVNITNYLLSEGHVAGQLNGILQNTVISTGIQPQQFGGITVQKTTTNQVNLVVDRSKPGYTPQIGLIAQSVSQSNNLVSPTNSSSPIQVNFKEIGKVGDLIGAKGISLTQSSERQRFIIDLPARPDSIVIIPYDPAYLTQTFGVHATGPKTLLGEFKLQPRKHRIEVTVQTASGAIVQGVDVYVDGADQKQFTDKNGRANFVFVNNSTRNFRLDISNPDPKLGTTPSLWIVPKSQFLTSTDINQVQKIKIIVQPAKILKGSVKIAHTNQVVEGAVVFVDQGIGSESDMRTVSKADGTFELIVPEVSSLKPDVTASIKVNYTKPGKTYIGSVQRVVLKDITTDTRLNLIIQERHGIDLSMLHGIPLRVNRLDSLPGGNFLIDGELFDLPANENFALRSGGSSEQVLQIVRLEVKFSKSLNENGIPYAVSVSEDLGEEPSFYVLNRNLDLKAYSVFKAQMEGYNQEQIQVIAQSDTTASIHGQVRIVDNSFNFPTSYMTIANQDFYLGNYGSRVTNNMKYYIPVFNTNGLSRAKFSILSVQNKQPRPIQFKYLGFDGLTDQEGERESYIEGDSIVLFMKLSTMIKGNIPLNFSGGMAVIKHDRLVGVNTSSPVEFNLESWKIKSNSWKISSQSGGIVLEKGILQASKIDVPFTDMQVIPGELICNSLTGNSLKDKLKIGGGLEHKLNVYGQTEVIFQYDPDVGKIAGKGHYKLSLTNPISGNAAYLEKMDGMTNPVDRIDIQYVSLLSNGEDLFSFSPKQKAITMRNQISFTPENLVSYEDRLVLTGSSNLHIRGLSEKLYSEFAYFKDQSNVLGHRLEIRPFNNLQFTGAGGTQFRVATSTEAQVFTNETIGFSGEVILPSGEAIMGNLISTVTSQIGQVAAEYAKKQADVIIGNGLGEDLAGNFAGQIGDALSQSLKKTRDDVLNTLNAYKDTYNQAIAIGKAGQQVLGDLAAKWRLAGEGMDAINKFDKDPVGSLMQLNGVFEGFTGIDLKEEATQKAKMVAKSALKGFQEQFPVSNMLPSGGANSEALKDGFANMKFDFDMKLGRITGSLSIKKLEFGAASFEKVGIEMLMDREGWYLYAGTKINVPSVPMIFPLSAGFLVGYYPTISPDLKSRVLTTAYVKKLPNIWENNQQPFSGFFFTGGKDIIPETKLDLDIGILAFEIGAHAGFDARLYANFGGSHLEVGVGAMVFANFYARLSVAAGLAGVEGSVSAELAASGRFRVINSNVSAALQACASLVIAGKAWAGPYSASYQEGIGALLTIDSARKPVVDFAIQFGGVKCSENPAFDY